MKTILVLAYLVVTTSCASQKVKSPIVEDSSSEITSEEKMLVGVVRTNDRICTYYLEVSENGQMITMYPVNLEDNLKIDGVKIKFTYLPSRAMQPENCRVDKVVALVEVIPLK